MRPGCCTELSASLLTLSTPLGVTRFIPWHFRQKATPELNLKTNEINHVEYLLVVVVEIQLEILPLSVELLKKHFPFGMQQ